jgi:hypothetical protein
LTGTGPGSDLAFYVDFHPFDKREFGWQGIRSRGVKWGQGARDSAAAAKASLLTVASSRAIVPYPRIFEDVSQVISLDFRVTMGTITSLYHLFLAFYGLKAFGLQFTRGVTGEDRPELGFGLCGSAPLYELSNPPWGSWPNRTSLTGDATWAGAAFNDDELGAKYTFDSRLWAPARHKTLIVQGGGRVG